MYFQHYMLSKLRNWYFTSKIRRLQVFFYIIQYIEVRIDLAIYFPTYFCVLILLQYFQCLPTLPCLQTSWTSLHGTKVKVTVQYVYIVTRGFELMFIGVIHLILSRSRHTTLALYSFRSISRYNGWFSSYTINSC